MEFVVDKVTEDSFYENFLLGLPKLLNEKLGITSTYLLRHPPVNESDLNLWETNHGVPLPKDLRQFYSATDGFLFSWTFSSGDIESDDIVNGKIDINHIFDLIPVYGYETRSEPSVAIANGRYEIGLTLESKIFELVPLNGIGKVVLVYITTKYAPTVWLVTSRMKFYYLADDFTSYVRMAIAHLGIPNWQFTFTPKIVPQWSEQLFRIMAPHLLPLNKRLETMKERKIKYNQIRKIPLNRINPEIFDQLPTEDHEAPAPPPAPAPTCVNLSATPSGTEKKKQFKLKSLLKYNRRLCKVKKY